MLTDFFLTFLLASPYSVQEQRKVEPDIELDAHKSGIVAVAISPNGKMAASVEAATNDIQLWTFPGGKRIRTLEGPKTHAIRAIAFSPDEMEISAACGESVFQWDLKNLGQSKETKLATEMGHRVNSVAYSFNANNLGITIGDDLLIWDRKEKKTIHKYSIQGKGLSRVLFGNKSKIVVGAGCDWSIRIWQAGSPEVLLKGHSFLVADMALVNEESVLVSASWDQKLIFWDLKKRTIMKTFEFKRPVSSVSYSAATNTLAVATLGEGIYIIDTKKAQLIKKLREGSSISSLAISTDGNYLLIGHGDISPSKKDNRGRLSIVRLILD